MPGQPTARIAVAGGVYREWCMRPAWREIYGSAGRAASAISSMGALVDLHAYMDSAELEVLQSRGALEGFCVIPTSASRTITFEYHHGLETPRIYGPREPLPPLVVSGDQIIRFGILSGDAQVFGHQVVYDPQDASAPKSFWANGSTADQLALILNRHEAELLTGLHGAPATKLADQLIHGKEAHVAVIKLGPQGSLVHDGSTIHRIPAYKTDRVWKIGSGDNFVAHFAFRWMHEGKSPAESANLASIATAYYCQTRGFATPDILETFQPEPIRPSESCLAGHRAVVYLAGPFFTLAQLWLIQQARTDLMAMGLRVFSPFHDVGHGSAEDVVQLDLDAIDKADLVFAVGDGLDSGTIYEIGYARAKGIPVIIYCENESDESKKMMKGSDCMLCDDYVTAIYQTLWAACTV